MNCPACRVSMQEKVYESIKLDECPSCQGVWLDEGEVKQIAEDRSLAFSLDQKLKVLDLGLAPDSEHRRHCPKCKSELTLVQYAVDSGIYIDRCPNKHGIFLDSGEIESIQIFFERVSGQNHSEKREKLHRVCPNDGTPLSLVKCEAETLDQCPKCQGVWCDVGELRRVIQQRLVNFVPANAVGNAPKSYVKLEKDRHCILCHAKMQSSIFAYDSGIQLDTCPLGHGLWLDPEELQKIEAYMKLGKGLQRDRQAVWGSLSKNIAAQADATTGNFDREAYAEIWAKRRMLSRGAALGFLLKKSN